MLSVIVYSSYNSTVGYALLQLTVKDLDFNIVIGSDFRIDI